MSLLSIITLIFLAAMVMWLPVLISVEKKKKTKSLMSEKQIISELNILSSVLFYACLLFSVFYVFVYYNESINRFETISIFLLTLISFSVSFYFYRNKTGDL